MAETLSVEQAVLLRVLGMSQRTLRRKQVQRGRLSPAISDRLSRIDRVYTLAVAVFGADEKAVQWLKRSSRALANEMPLNLLDTDAGTQRVERENYARFSTAAFLMPHGPAWTEIRGCSRMAAGTPWVSA